MKESDQRHLTVRIADSGKVITFFLYNLSCFSVVSVLLLCNLYTLHFFNIKHDYLWYCRDYVSQFLSLLIFFIMKWFSLFSRSPLSSHFLFCLLLVFCMDNFPSTEMCTVVFYAQRICHLVIYQTVSINPYTSLFYSNRNRGNCHDGAFEIYVHWKVDSN